MSPEELELERFRAAEQIRLETQKHALEITRIKYAAEWDFYRENQNVLARGVLDFGLFALRGLLFFNGGALVALLTLTGAVWSADLEQGQILAATLDPALKCFGAGVFLALLATVCAYVAQVFFTEDVLKDPESNRTCGNGWRYAAIISGAASLICFGVGVYLAASSLGGN